MGIGARELDFDVRVVLLSLTVSLLAVAAWTDVTTRLIPNWVSILLALDGVASRVFAGFGALALSVLAAAAVFGVLAVIHARGWLGGGDVKLLAATSVQFPPAGVWGLVAATSIAGGILALLHLMCRRLPRPARCPRGTSLPRRIWTIERWRARRAYSLPYGVAIACGGVWMIFLGWRS
jgi:prepilin peptidase CpaA